MEKAFNNLEELRTEIGILKLKVAYQEDAIQEKLNGPFAIIKSIGSLFKGTKKKDGAHDDEDGQDIFSIISRVLLPVILNKSLFRGSGFITKTLVTLFSQQAAKNVNMDVVTNMIDKISGIFKSKKERKPKAALDYGIPPDSETY
jgi:hypothetical protein